MSVTIDPIATYHYVYYGISGSHSRQPRTGTTPAYVPIPGVSQPGGNGTVTGNKFYLQQPAISYPDPDDSLVSFKFGYMNVLGLAEGGQLINQYNYDYSDPVGTVGTSTIDIWVVYYAVGGDSGGNTSGATIDALDETTGSLLSDTFVEVFDPGATAPNAIETGIANEEGYVDTTDQSETIQADQPTVLFPSGVPSNEKFDQWQIFYGGTVAAATPTILTAPKGVDTNALAFYRSPLIWPCPCPYVNGGYQSPDIILIDPATGAQVLWDDTPKGTTLLKPNYKYILQALVHNDSSNDALNTAVTFWEVGDGTGSTATLLDVQTIPVSFVIGAQTIPNAGNAAIIPAGSAAIFQSSTGYWSGNAPLFPAEHNCAAVSVYNPISDCCTQATNPTELQALQNNSVSGQPSCSAYRNTDTQIVYPGPFHFGLGLGDLRPLFGPEPIEVQINVTTKYVPVAWNKEPKVVETAGIFKSAGIHLSYPLFLLPVLRSTVKPAELDTKVTIEKGGKLVKKEKGYILHAEAGKSTSYEVSGVIPDTAAAGDIYLLTVTAHYPATKRVPAASVEFLEVLRVVR
jgi:hypothetical protein